MESHHTESQAMPLRTKNHPIKKITTRAYYPGLHRLEIAVNGFKLNSGEFELRM